MLLNKGLRPEKISVLIHNFVLVKLGSQFANAKRVVMEEIYADSDNKVPIVFILTQGADPYNQILKFTLTKKENIEDNLHIISLGQGQDEPARKALETSRKNGNWVLLQNCHLYKSFMPELERIVLDI